MLTFDIVIDTKLSAETKKNIEELREAKTAKTKDVTGITEEKAEATDEFSPEQLEQVKSVLGEELGGLDKNDLAQLGAFAKNPQAGMTKTLTRLLGGRGAAILGPLAIAVTAPIVMVEILKAMSVKGGPFNRDWRRFIEEEVEVGLSRVQQKEKEMGITQTILTQIAGFKQNNENFTYNSLYEINDSRLARVGLSDREAGVTIFLG